VDRAQTKAVSQSPPPNAGFISGVVEGFYGRPWNPEQRHQLFQWLRTAGLDTYLYAPKDDLKHRVVWRELYDNAEVAELRALTADCASHGLRFIYALAPGLDIRYARPEEMVALEMKVAQMCGLGVVHFAILFDDIPARLDLEDERRYGSVAVAQAAVTNQLAGSVRRRAPGAEILFCPTEYSGRMARPSVGESAYLRELGENLAPEVAVLWTGPEIVSETVPVESLRELQAVLRRKPVLWDNLHANDYDLRRLYLGPYTGRAPELRNEVAGILLNPNCQFEANFVPVHTLGSYVRGAPESRTPRQAYQDALSAWLPAFHSRAPEPFTRAELEWLGDLLYLPTEFGEQAQLYLDDLSRVLLSAPGDWGQAGARLEQASRQIVALYEKLTTLTNRNLLHAFYAHVWELKELALLILAWLRWRQEHPDPNPTQRFASPEFRPGIFRGGFGARLERLLPMDDQGRFGNP